MYKDKEHIFERYAINEIQQGRVKNKDSYDIGDRVWLFSETDTNKLASRWTDGYIVIERLESDSYKVNGYGREYRINKTFLKHDTRSNREVSVSR